MKLRPGHRFVLFLIVAMAIANAGLWVAEGAQRPVGDPAQLPTPLTPLPPAPVTERPAIDMRPQPKMKWPPLDFDVTNEVNSASTNEFDRRFFERGTTERWLFETDPDKIEFTPSSGAFLKIVGWRVAFEPFTMMRILVPAYDEADAMTREEIAYHMGWDDPYDTGRIRRNGIDIGSIERRRR